MLPFFKLIFNNFCQAFLQQNLRIDNVVGELFECTVLIDCFWSCLLMELALVCKNAQVIWISNSACCHIQLSMSEDTVWQINNATFQTVALALVDGHCEGWSDGGIGDGAV